MLTGILIGLGAATKLYPLFLLGALLVICLGDRRLLRFAMALTAAVGVLLTVYAGYMLARIGLRLPAPAIAGGPLADGTVGPPVSAGPVPEPMCSLFSISGST